MPEMAKKITDNLRGDYRVFYDESGAVGRRYRRQDEAGTPFCITIDNESLENNTATIRHRDSMKQDRIAVGQIKKYLADQIKA